jgi:hypothetical protein
MNHKFVQMSWNFMNDSLRTDCFVRYRTEFLSQKLSQVAFDLILYMDFFRKILQQLVWFNLGVPVAFRASKSVSSLGCNGKLLK